MKHTFLIFFALIFPILGIILGVLSVFWQAEGRFVSWQSLGSPPDKITHIKAVDCGTVVVETVGYRLYMTNLRKHWEQISEMPYLSAEDNEGWDYEKPASLPDVVERMEATQVYAEYRCHATFALRADGNIYVWHQGWGGVDMLLLCVYPLLGMLGGGAIALPLFVAGVALAAKHAKK